jgi:hypothetical protein
MNKGKILKGAGVLFVVAIMSLSAIAATAHTTENAVSLSSKPATFVQPQIETTGRAILWDQYDTDGSNGLSHSDPTSSVAFRRDLLDDFEIPAGETWILTDLHSLNLWNTMQPGVGTDFVLSFCADNAGTPGTTIANAVTVSYTETATGRTWFSRPEFEIEYVYEPITLSEGIYWICGHVVGPENCFWMARETIWRSECWTDYADLPPPGPGSVIFGSPYDLAFQLTGELQQPAVPDLETDGDLSWVDISAGATVTGNFGIGNVGEPGSFLNWEVIEWPDWGTWTFTPASGTGLPEGDWVSCDVTVVAPPDKNTEFTGKVKVINSDDPSDYEEIDVYLKTPKAKAYTQPSFLRTLLERFPNAFPILRYMLGL